MLRDPLLDYGVRNREQVIRQLRERAVLFRRARFRHADPMIAPLRTGRAAGLFVVLLLLGTCALTQSPRQDQTPAPNSNQNQGNDTGPASQPSTIQPPTTAKVGSDTEPKPTYWQQVFSPSNLPNVVLAFFALAGTVFAIFTLVKLSQQTEAEIIAANAAKQALIMVNRPRLVLRPITVNGIEHGRIVSTRLTDGEAWITNVGVLPATLLHFHAQWLFTDKLPLENPAHRTPDLSTAPSPVQPGHFGKRALPDYEVPQHAYRTINTVAKVGTNSLSVSGTLYLIGYIKYSDEIGLRRTFFLFGYDPIAGHFRPVEHPNYSYEE